jgi:hypothetical protein
MYRRTVSHGTATRDGPAHGGGPEAPAPQPGAAGFAETRTIGTRPPPAARGVVPGPRAGERPRARLSPLAAVCCVTGPGGSGLEDVGAAVAP